MQEDETIDETMASDYLARPLRLMAREPESTTKTMMTRPRASDKDPRVRTADVRRAADDSVDTTPEGRRLAALRSSKQIPKESMAKALAVTKGQLEALEEGSLTMSDQDWGRTFEALNLWVEEHT